MKGIRAILLASVVVAVSGSAFGQSSNIKKLQDMKVTGAPLQLETVPDHAC
jgi:hypothetical protein